MYYVLNPSRIRVSKTSNEVVLSEAVEIAGHRNCNDALDRKIQCRCISIVVWLGVTEP